MFLSDISIKRPIMMSMILVALMLFGIIAYFGLNLDLIPDVSIPVITIQTIYPGGGPQEIESQVTKRIEDAVSSISNIDELTSYSMEAVSFVFITFDLSKDIDIAAQEVKEKVDVILNDLPDDAEQPIIQKVDINAKPVIDVVMSGNLEMTKLYDLADKTLRDRFAQIEGVANVNVTGGGEREIRVQLDNRTVFQHNISLTQLAGFLTRQNMDMPGGHFEERSQEYAVRLKGELDDVETLKNLKVPTGFGMKKLGDIADVQDASEEVRVRTSFFDNIKQSGSDNVVLLSLIKAKDGNTVKVAEAAKKLVPVIQKELPGGTELSIVTDRSILIEGSVEDTLSNIIMGILLTGLVLFFFLHDLRSTTIVALSMPLSILSTFLVLQISGFTLNLMTLMGLSTAVGVLVTNSVVVLENIFRHKEMGHSSREAAGKGTAEVVVAVVASTMTNIAVFLPIANMSGIMGMFFKEFALTVVYATLFSLLMSFTLTPMMAALILPDRDTKKHPIGKKMEAMFHTWENMYQKMLAWVITRKRRSFLIVAASIVFFFASFGMGSRIGFDFMPSLDEGDIKVEVELPTGYNLEQTADLMAEIERRSLLHGEISTVITTLGQIDEMNVATNNALLKIKLVSVDERNLTTKEVVAQLIHDFSDIPNSRIRVAALSSMGMRAEPVNFVLMGQDVDTLEVYKVKVLEKITGIPGMINFNTSSRPGKPEITLHPDREKLTAAGLTMYDLALTLRSALEGMVTTKYRDKGNEYDIRVSLSDESVDTPEEIGNIAIVGPGGTYRFSQLCDVDFTEGYSRIVHQDKYKMIEFSAGLAPGVALGDVNKQINSRLADVKLPPGYQVKWTGMSKMMYQTIRDMLFTFALAFLLTYMLLAAILESLTQPLLILGTVPLAFIGVFGGLFISGISMNSISMMAIVMLLGIVVNNAILLLDYTNILVRDRGYSIHDALLEACPTKLKPILMSSIAIILGMLPMALGIGASGREFRQPMGVVSIGGLVVSTVLALIIIPALYYLTAKEKKMAVADEKEV
ncbi:efflux RND transporter permease subunit [candidate division KSB1 bacterium]|nr:efflux RND transporter permease subunit [candidate division KSB1 bacterium]